MALSAAATEGGDEVTLNLLDGATDVDNNATLSAVLLGDLPAGFSFADNQLTVDPTNSAFANLAAGEERSIIIIYNIVDEEGGSVEQTATFTVTGTNDAPTVDGALTGSVTEDDAVLELNLLAGASDIDAGAVLSVDPDSVTGLGEGVTLEGSTLTVDGSADRFQSLSIGQTAEITVTFDIVDEQGMAVSQTATITVTGTNDAPTLESELAFTIAEDVTLIPIIIALEGADDVDQLDSLSVENIQGLEDLGTAVVYDAGLGIFLVDSADASFQSMAVGDTRDIEITFDVVDGNGGSVQQTLTITITGTNDAPTVASALTASATEGEASFTINLLEGAADVDDGAVLTAVVAALPPGFNFDADTNSVTFDPTDSFFDSLAEGEVQTLTFDYIIRDENNAEVAQTLSVTVTGTNDAPVVTGSVSGAATEGGDAVMVNLLEGASDIDNGAVLSVLFDDGLPPGVTVDGTTLTLNPSAPEYEALAEGQIEEFNITYQVVDENGAAVSQTVTLTVTGTNDVPVVEAALAAAATEGGEAVTLNLLDGASDVDGLDMLSIVLNINALETGFSLDGTNLVVDPSNSVFDELAEGETRDVTLDYQITDGNGGIVDQTATVTITGTNDAPTVLFSLSSNVIEGSGETDFNLLIGASDVDNNAVLSVELLDEVPEGARLDGTTLFFDANSEAYDGLNEGEVMIIDINYVISDGLGGEVQQSLQLTVEGTNDAPTVAGVVTATANEDDDSFAVDLLAGANDVDFGDVLSVDLGGIELPAGFELIGTTLNVNPSDPAYQSLPEGEELVLEIEYNIVDLSGASVAQTASVTIIGANDAPTRNGFVANQVTEIDELFTLDVDDDLFTDIDSGDSLTITAALSNGDPLPSWLSFDPETLTFSGTPTQGDTGVFNVRITATDTSGATNSDVFTLQVGADIIFGTAGDDTLNGTNGDDIFFGLEGNDTISGGNGSDMFTGGLGNDRLEGNGGNDTYIFNIGDGQDIVDDGGFNGTDTLQFNNRNLADATFTREGGSDTFTIIFANGDSVEVIDGLDASFGDIEQVVFDDVILDVQGLRDAVIGDDATDGDDILFGTDGNDILDGLGGNDTISGGNGNDMITGGLGNDRLEGNGGNDTYIFNIGDGQDIVDDGGFNGTDTLQFNNRSLADATFTREGGSDTFTIIFANGDSVEVIDGLDASFGDIEQVVFDDVILDVQGLRDAVIGDDATDGDDILFGTDGNDILDGLGGNDTISGGNGNDMITGGLGNDRLEGNGGNDTYIFNIGDGQDIVDDGGFNGTDTLQFNNRSLADATFTREGGSDTFTIIFANGDSVEVIDGLDASFGDIEQVVFDDVTSGCPRFARSRDR